MTWRDRARRAVRTPEGDLVVVRGTIQAETTLRGVLVEAEACTAAHRRRAWQLGARAAVDFTLLDDAGNYISSRPRAPADRAAPRARHLSARGSSDRTCRRAPPADRRDGRGRGLRAGAGRRTVVQVIGYKTRARTSQNVVDYGCRRSAPRALGPEYRS